MTLLVAKTSSCISIKFNILYMKTAYNLFFVLTMFVLASCGSEHQHEHGAGGGDGNAHGATKEFNSAYVCPMHCEGSGSDQPGKCPVCEMDYEALSEHVKDGHVH